MANLRTLSLRVLTGALLFTTALTAQQFAPKVRIVDRIDESNLVALKGNTHPLANAKNDLGRVSSNLPMTDLILVLSRDAAAAGGFREVRCQPVRFQFAQLPPVAVSGSGWRKFGPSLTDIAAYHELVDREWIHREFGKQGPLVDPLHWNGWSGHEYFPY